MGNYKQKPLALWVIKFYSYFLLKSHSETVAVHRNICFGSMNTKRGRRQTLRRDVGNPKPGCMLTTVNHFTVESNRSVESQ